MKFSFRIGNFVRVGHILFSRIGIEWFWYVSYSFLDNNHWTKNFTTSSPWITVWHMGQVYLWHTESIGLLCNFEVHKGDPLSHKSRVLIQMGNLNSKSGTWNPSPYLGFFRSTPFLFLIHVCLSCRRRKLTPWCPSPQVVKD